MTAIIWAARALLQQAAGDVRDEVRAHRVVEGSLPQVAARVSDALAEPALPADVADRGIFVAH